MKRVFRMIGASVITLFFVGYHFLFPAVFAEESSWKCPIEKGAYQWQICNCLEKRKVAQAKTISEYVCPEGILADQDVAYQVILDLEFQKIDKDADGRLRQMQARTGKDFVEMDREVTNWFDTTSEKSEFYERYSKVCSDLSDSKNVLRQTVEAFGSGESVSTDSQTVQFSGNSAWCDSLVVGKLSAYKGAARIFVQNNVVKSYKEDKRDFVGRLKKEYENFLMKWMVYLGELSRIKDKWINKTPRHNSQ